MRPLRDVPRRRLGWAPEPAHEYHVRSGVEGRGSPRESGERWSAAKVMGASIAGLMVFGGLALAIEIHDDRSAMTRSIVESLRHSISPAVIFAEVRTARPVGMAASNAVQPSGEAIAAPAWPEPNPRHPPPIEVETDTRVSPSPVLLPESKGAEPTITPEPVRIAAIVGTTTIPAVPQLPGVPKAPVATAPAIAPSFKPAPSEIDALLAKAEAALHTGDVAVARSFFNRVAQAGDVRGAVGMGRTYDDAILKQLPVFGLKPDRTEAEKWYSRAKAMGSSRAVAETK